VTALNAAGGGTLIQAGLITTAERDTFRRLLDDPSFVGNYPFPSHPGEQAQSTRLNVLIPRPNLLRLVLSPAWRSLAL
jgi:hypothetical protein